MSSNNKPTSLQARILESNRQRQQPIEEASKREPKFVGINGNVLKKNKTYLVLQDDSAASPTVAFYDLAGWPTTKSALVKDSDFIDWMNDEEGLVGLQRRKGAAVFSSGDFIMKVSDTL